MLNNGWNSVHRSPNIRCQTNKATSMVTSPISDVIMKLVGHSNMAASSMAGLASLQAWLGQELEMRGIDASIYTRYILSILQQDTFHTDDIDSIAEKQFFSPNRPKVVKSKSGRANRKLGRRKTTGIDVSDLEQKKKMAAIECLLSLSDEDSGIEGLVDEVFLKLKEEQAIINCCEGRLDERSLSGTSSGSDSDSSEITIDPAQRYYAAFPALSTEVQPVVISVVPESGVWAAKVTQGLARYGGITNIARFATGAKQVLPDLYNSAFGRQQNAERFGQANHTSNADWPHKWPLPPEQHDRRSRMPRHQNKDHKFKKDKYKWMHENYSSQSCERDVSTGVSEKVAARIIKPWKEYESMQPIDASSLRVKSVRTNVKTESVLDFFFKSRAAWSSPLFESLGCCGGANIWECSPTCSGSENQSWYTEPLHSMVKPSAVPSQRLYNRAALTSGHEDTPSTEDSTSKETKAEDNPIAAVDALGLTALLAHLTEDSLFEHISADDDDDHFFSGMDDPRVLHELGVDSPNTETDIMLSQVFHFTEGGAEEHALLPLNKDVSQSTSQDSVNKGATSHVTEDIPQSPGLQGKGTIQKHLTEPMIYVLGPGSESSSESHQLTGPLLYSGAFWSTQDDSLFSSVGSLQEDQHCQALEEFNHPNHAVGNYGFLDNSNFSRDKEANYFSSVLGPILEEVGLDEEDSCKGSEADDTENSHCLFLTELVEKQEKSDSGQEGYLGFLSVQVPACVDPEHDLIRSELKKADTIQEGKATDILSIGEVSSMFIPSGPWLTPTASQGHPEVDVGSCVSGFEETDQLPVGHSRPVQDKGEIKASEAKSFLQSSTPIGLITEADDDHPLFYVASEDEDSDVNDGGRTSLCQSRYQCAEGGQANGDLSSIYHSGSCSESATPISYLCAIDDFSSQGDSSYVDCMQLLTCKDCRQCNDVGSFSDHQCTALLNCDSQHSVSPLSPLVTNSNGSYPFGNSLPEVRLLNDHPPYTACTSHEPFLPDLAGDNQRESRTYSQLVLPNDGKDSISHLWDINAVHVCSVSHLVSPKDKEKQNLYPYLVNIPIEVPRDELVMARDMSPLLSGTCSTWDVSTCLSPYGHPPYSQVPQVQDESHGDTFQLWQNFELQPHCFRQRSTSADYTTPEADCCTDSVPSRSIELLPSENSAFSDQIPERVTQLSHVKSEPALDRQRLLHGRVYNHGRRIQVRSLYKPETNMLQQLNQDSGYTEDAQTSVEVQPHTHFLPIKNDASQTAEVSNTTHVTTKPEASVDDLCAVPPPTGPVPEVCPVLGRQSNYQLYHHPDANDKRSNFVPRFQVQKATEKCCQTATSCTPKLSVCDESDEDEKAIDDGDLDEAINDESGKESDKESDKEPDKEADEKEEEEEDKESDKEYDEPIVDTGEDKKGRKVDTEHESLGMFLYDMQDVLEIKAEEAERLMSCVANTHIGGEKEDDHDSGNDESMTADHMTLEDLEQAGLAQLWFRQHSKSPGMETSDDEDTTTPTIVESAKVGTTKPESSHGHANTDRYWAIWSCNAVDDLPNISGGRTIDLAHIHDKDSKAPVSDKLRESSPEHVTCHTEELTKKSRFEFSQYLFDDNDDEEDVYIDDPEVQLQLAGIDSNPDPDQVIFSTDLEEQWLSTCSSFTVQVPKPGQHKTGVYRKACSFFLEGNCRRTDCKFAHDISNITCRFWEESNCFKGPTCPFLHGYSKKK